LVVFGRAAELEMFGTVAEPPITRMK